MFTRYRTSTMFSVLLVTDEITEQNRFVPCLWEPHSSIWKDLDSHERGIFYFMIKSYHPIFN